jgi:autotransporter-associated beta strand protein
MLFGTNAFAHSPMNTNIMKPNCLLTVALLTLPGTVMAEINTWDDPESLHAWLTATNWSLDAVPSASDIAQFANSGSANSCGINMNTAEGNVTIQAVEVTSARTRALTIGNSSGTVGTLNLTGGTVNGVSSTILRNASTSLFTLKDSETITVRTMDVVIKNPGSIIAAEGPITIGSKLSGPGFTKTGAGTLTLTGSNVFSGPITVDAGTLALSAATSLAGASLITIQSGASIDGSADGVTLAVNQTLSGNGTITGNLNIAGTLSPGSSPGMLTINGKTTWLPGGNFAWQILDVDAGPGSGWDALAIDGALDLSQLTEANPFSLNLWSLAPGTPDEVNGDVPGFLGSQNYTWSIATATDGITGFNAANFHIEIAPIGGTGGFTNDLAPGGSFDLVVSGNSLDLVYSSNSAVPEPASGLATAGLLASALLLRRRIRTAG